MSPVVLHKCIETGNYDQCRVQLCRANLGCSSCAATKLQRIEQHSVWKKSCATIEMLTRLCHMCNFVTDHKLHDKALLPSCWLSNVVQLGGTWQLPVNSSHGHLVTWSCRHKVNSSLVNSSHTRLITQSTRHKTAHNKATSTSRNYLICTPSGDIQKQYSTWTA